MSDFDCGRRHHTTMKSDAVTLGDVTLHYRLTPAHMIRGCRSVVTIRHSTKPGQE